MRPLNGDRLDLKNSKDEIKFRLHSALMLEKARLNQKCPFTQTRIQIPLKTQWLPMLPFHENEMKVFLLQQKPKDKNTLPASTNTVKT